MVRHRRPRLRLVVARRILIGKYHCVDCLDYYDVYDGLWLSLDFLSSHRLLVCSVSLDGLGVPGFLK